MRQGNDRRGFALMAALWLVVIVGLTGYELSMRSRAGRLAVANALELTVARAAAEAGLVTIQSRLADALLQPLTASRLPLDNRALDRWNALSNRTDTIDLGGSRAVATTHDAASRLNINRASEADLRRLLIALQLDAGAADRLAQAIADWRDADDFPRARGAERDDYVRVGARVLPSNRPFARIEELREIVGMTPALYSRLAPYVTLSGAGQVNANSAATAVLASLPGIGPEAVAALVRAREGGRPVHSLDELRRALSPGATRVVDDAGQELEQRLVFETREMVVTLQAWPIGSPVRASAEALFTRSGDAVLTSARRVKAM